MGVLGAIGSRTVTDREKLWGNYCCNRYSYVAEKYSEMTIFLLPLPINKNAQNYWETTEIQLPLRFPKKWQGHIFSFRYRYRTGQNLAGINL
eukprot:3494710-Amphidinium_carterae.1